MTRIAVLDDYQAVARSLADWDRLKPPAETVFFHDHVTDLGQLAARLADYDALVLTRERTTLDAALIARLPRLRFVTTFGMWNAAIDLDAAAARGIVVSGTEGADPDATPALTWGLILAVTRGLYAEASSLRAGGWQIGLGTDIAGKTLGVIGLGAIGRRVAEFGRVFGMKVLGWSRSLTDADAAALGIERAASKDALISRSDVLTLHLKLNETSRHLIGARELALMRPTAYLVNTSRGPVVEEAALIAALQERRIAGAALDVFEPEPLPPLHPFRYLPNVLATPHLGGASESRHRHGYEQCVENLAAWLDGAPVRLMTKSLRHPSLRPAAIV